jgi:cupin 2 domain-containing protein
LPEGELVEVLCRGRHGHIERIVSQGEVSPPGFWYDQEQAEWVLLLQGSAELAFEDGSKIGLQTGEYLLLPAHQKHRIDYTSKNPPCIWLCVFADEK